MLRFNFDQISHFPRRSGFFFFSLSKIAAPAPCGPQGLIYIVLHYFVSVTHLPRTPLYPRTRISVGQFLIRFSLSSP
jgi:hypothetical protein